MPCDVFSVYLQSSLRVVARGEPTTLELKLFLVIKKKNRAAGQATFGQALRAGAKGTSSVGLYKCD
jgi:hypothetical protein